LKLHLFNPENDLALAHAAPNFTPPAPVREFHRAAAALPLWYASAGDCVYAPEVDHRWWDEMCQRFSLDVSLGNTGAPAPWGWSANAVRQFRKIGIDGPFPPDVERLRQLSHRRTAMQLHALLKDSLPYELPPTPREITAPEQLPLGTDFFLKAPWSGSGRGVIDCALLPRVQVEKQAAGIISRQGSVMLEPRLPRVRDFAMLYEATDSGVEYRGLSLFFNTTACAYGGNLVASEEELQRWLNVPYLKETATAVGHALTQLLGADYRGPLGVDMMLYGEDCRICPTVEVNLRMTMGHVARHLAAKGLCGVMTMSPQQAAPAGVLSLLPPSSSFSIYLNPLVHAQADGI
jgi:hypothetical protein